VKHQGKNFWKLGQAYFIRTVTHHISGRLVGIDEHEIIFEDAAWIADDGRYSDAMKTGNLLEIEPYPDGMVVIGRGSIIDGCFWEFDLPRNQK